MIYFIIKIEEYSFIDMENQNDMTLKDISIDIDNTDNTKEKLVSLNNLKTFYNSIKEYVDTEDSNLSTSIDGVLNTSKAYIDDLISRIDTWIGGDYDISKDPKDPNTPFDENLSLDSRISALEAIDHTQFASAAAEEKINEILENAPEAFNTFKDIADYISEDQSGAEALVNKVNELEASHETIVANTKKYTDDAIKAEKITYKELKAKRDSGELVPGKKYRITDYVTKVYSNLAISAEHPFDVIVTALDESTLSEEAMAIQHEGDTYFANSNLAAWKIWYCLDNDETRFGWLNNINQAVSNNCYGNIKGIGTINGDEVILDTSNIEYQNKYIVGFQFINNPYTGLNSHVIILFDYLGPNPDNKNGEISVKAFYNGHKTIDGKEYDVWRPENDSTKCYLTDCIVTDENTAGAFELPCTGVIYRMIDEFGNDCPYDFKNVMFASYICGGSKIFGSATYSTNYKAFYTKSNIDMDINGDYSLMNTLWNNTDTTNYCNGKFLYTFSFINGDDTSGNGASTSLIISSLRDTSLNSVNTDKVYKNKFDPYYKNNIQQLNCNVLCCYGSSVTTPLFYNNIFGLNTHDNTFNTCYNNTVGYNFYNNCFQEFYYNNFEYSIYNNFILSCTSNSVLNNFYENEGAVFGSNSVGDRFNNNKFQNMRSNTIGNSVYNNTFAGFMASSIEYNCYDITCFPWTDDNTLKASCSRINIMRGSGIAIDKSCNGTSSSPTEITYDSSLSGYYFARDSEGNIKQINLADQSTGGGGSLSTNYVESTKTLVLNIV